MHDPASPARHVRFGAFELDLRSGELRKGPTRLKVPDQSIEILKALLEQPGELVTREQLRERLWPADTFVDFEHGLNAAVRRLREALGDSADAPRFIETLPRRGYRFVGAVEAAPKAPPPVLEPVNLPSPALPLRRRGRRTALVAITAALLLVLVVAIAVVAMYRRAVGEPHRPDAAPLTRLTWDPGLQTDPTFSPDATSIAYSSNKSGDFDIWMQPIAGGSSVRVTNNPAHDSQPDWSPDRGSIVFRSERDGGGLFLVPHTGGQEEQLTTFGYLPRWSPDGSRVLFWENALLGSPRGRLYTVGRNGEGPWPVDISAILATERQQVAAGWYPDSKAVTFLLARPQHALKMTKIELSSGVATQFDIDQGVQQAFRERPLWGVALEPLVWAPDRRTVFFVGMVEGLWSVWAIDVDPSRLRITGGPHRLTTLAERSSSIAMSRDGRRLAFGAASRNARIWSYPLESGGHIVGVPVALTPAALEGRAPDLTQDGAKILFSLRRLGSGTGLTEHHEIVDGHSRILKVDDFNGRQDRRVFPRWSPDGTSVVYRHSRRVQSEKESKPKQVGSLVLLDTRTLNESQLTTPVPDSAGKSLAPYGWTPDGRYVIASTGPSVMLIPVSGAPSAEDQATTITSSPEYQFWNTGMSPNGVWICFNATKGATSRLGIVGSNREPLRWLTDAAFWTDKPRWSVDGRLLYFISKKGGLFNVWAVAFDEASGTSKGDPFQITRFSGPGNQIPADMVAVELAVGRDRLAIPVVNPTGGIWLLDNLPR